MSFLTADFWNYALERAVKTFAQTAVATLTAAGVLGLFEIDAINVLSVASFGFVTSVLTSLSTYDEERDGKGEIKYVAKHARKDV